MSLKTKIEDELKKALKEGNSIRLSTLRLLLSALHNEEIAKQRQLQPDEEIQVVRNQAKMRQEAIEALRQAQAFGSEAQARRGKLTGKESDVGGRIKKEEEELGILKEFLPKQPSREQIEKIIDEVMATSEDKNFGSIMGQVMARVGQGADGRVVAEIVKRKILI